MTTFCHAGRKICVTLAEEVLDHGYLRLIDAIDPHELQKAIDRAINAFKGNVMMGEEEKSKIVEVNLQYIFCTTILEALILIMYLGLWNMRARKTPIHTQLRF